MVSDRRRVWRALLLAIGLLLVAPAFLPSVSAAPTSVSAANTQLDWVASDPSGADVTLDGSASSDDTVEFAWWEDCASLPCDGTQLVQDSPDAKIAQVTLPIGSHEITLWGADEAGEWIAAEPITVTVSAPAPVADAGADQSVDATSAGGADVTLDGTGSENGSSYSWSLDGTEVATGATPTVTLPLGVNDVTLTVTGWDGETTATDSVLVTVNPVAVAGADQTVDATSADGAAVSLDGTGSFGESLTWSTADNPNLATGVTPDPVTLPIGVNEVTLTATAPGDLSVTDTVFITVNPVANAGADQEVNAIPGDGADVVLDGSGSIGDLSTIVWTDADDNQLATGPNPTVNLGVGVHEITLTISGPGDVSDTDTVTVTVNEPPAINPGATQLVWDATSAEGAVVTLDGSYSSDDLVNFAWWENCAATPCPPEAERLAPDSPDSKVVEVPLAIGTHEITLWAQDADGDWSAAEPITITVNPVANAGQDQVVASENGTDAEVSLDGSASIGDLSTIVWTDAADNEIATGPTATVTLPLGVNEITMTISGPGGVSDSATVTITVAVAPEANAGDDQTVKAETDQGSTVTLNGSSSTAAGDATIVSWQWSTESNPDLADGETAQATLPIGTTTVTLTVTDSLGLTDTDTVDITVSVPAAHAGADQTVAATSAEGATVTLDGSASVGDIVSWKWSTDDNPDLATGETATVTLPIGEHDITLTVTDSEDNTDTDTVKVTVTVPTGNASAAVDPARGTVNSSVTYSLAFFPPDTEVQIEWIRASGGTIGLGTVTTDAIGGATDTIRVPATPGGANQLRFTAGTTTATADFEVAPRIKVIPDTVIPGQTVNVSLRGFAKQENVRVRWLVNGRYIDLKTVTTSNTGSANVEVIVPATAPAGPTSVRGDGTEFRAQTNAVNVVAPAGEPSASLSPERGTVNTHTDFAISNFPANATVSIAWQRTSGSLIDLGTVQTDASGTASGTIRVPATPGGDQLVHFTSGAISAAASYEVAPRIKVLDSGAVGDQVTVSLRGYGKNETVRIRWFANNQWLTVGTVTTSNTGSAHVTVTIPVGAQPGNNSVRGDGTQFRAQTNVALVTQ
ncbi:MAG TPA: hypothetical protein VFL82_02645 [Thermomicrobiales bacterium]|nr:hypothetical protein [Thermomicrobiales bacterium]